MTKTNCENCMWGDNCPISENCEFYDPINDDGSKLTYDKKSFDEEWRRYVHGQYSDQKITDIQKLFY